MQLNVMMPGFNPHHTSFMFCNYIPTHTKKKTTFKLWAQILVVVLNSPYEILLTCAKLSECKFAKLV